MTTKQDQTSSQPVQGEPQDVESNNELQVINILKCQVFDLKEVIERQRIELEELKDPGSYPDLQSEKYLFEHAQLGDIEIRQMVNENCVLKNRVNQYEKQIELLKHQSEISKYKILEKENVHIKQELEEERKINLQLTIENEHLKDEGNKFILLKREGDNEDGECVEYLRKNAELMAENLKLECPAEFFTQLEFVCGVANQLGNQLFGGLWKV